MSKLNDLICGVSLAIFAFGAPAIAQERPVAQQITLSGACPSCDLSDRDLTRMRISGASYAHANFTRSNLSGGSINGSDFSHATFVNAYLMRLEGHGANFSNANMRSASFTKSNLIGANFTKADLRKATLSKCEFHGAEFVYTDLTGATLTYANMNGANFTKATLDGADLSASNFVGANFMKADFGNAKVNGSIFSDANFTKADLSRVKGLKQDQLINACGDDETKLPAGLKLKPCVNAYVWSQPMPPEAPMGYPTVEPPRVTIRDIDVTSAYDEKLDWYDDQLEELEDAHHELVSVIEAMPEEGRDALQYLEQAAAILEKQHHQMKAERNALKNQKR